jgi:hypothetical protein
MPVTAIISLNISGVIPFLAAAAVWDAMQCTQPVVTRTGGGPLAKRFVQFDAVAGDQTIRLIGHAGNGHHFAKHFRRHALFGRGGGVGGDAVFAAGGDADGESR